MVIQLGLGLVQFEERRTQRLATHLVLAARRLALSFRESNPDPPRGATQTWLTELSVPSHKRGTTVVSIVTGPLQGVRVRIRSTIRVAKKSERGK